MDARSELLAYMGAALVTIVALFGLQIWYATYLDVSVVHARSHAPLNPQVAEVRAKERQKLESGRMPLAQAKAALAQNRAGLPQIAPQPSDDLSAMSGWMHKPNFKPYEPRKAPAAAAAPVALEEAPPVDAAPAPQAAATPHAAPPPPARRAAPVAPTAHP